MNDNHQYICIECFSSFDQSQIGSELFCTNCGGRLEDKKQFQNRHLISEEGAEKEDDIGDEELYLQATNEVNSDNRNPALWAKAMALSEGDAEKAKYSYIKYRVEQLIKETKETEVASSDIEIDEATLMEQYGITFANDKYIYQGYRYSNLDDAINYAKLLLNKKSAHNTSSSTHKSTDNIQYKEEKITSKSNHFALVGLILGILSIFFFTIGAIPIFAVVFSIIGILKIKETGKGTAQAWIGLILGIIYTIAYLQAYGHI